MYLVNGSQAKYEQNMNKKLVDMRFESIKSEENSKKIRDKKLEDEQSHVNYILVKMAQREDYLKGEL